MIRKASKVSSFEKITRTLSRWTQFLTNMKGWTSEISLEFLTSDFLAVLKFF